MHCVRLAASRTFCTAGKSSPIRIAMIAMTTSSSISVNAGLRRGFRILMGTSFGPGPVLPGRPHPDRSLAALITRRKDRFVELLVVHPYHLQGKAEHVAGAVHAVLFISGDREGVVLSGRQPVVVHSPKDHEFLP